MIPHSIVFDQIDACLANEPASKTVVLYGYEADGTAWVTSVEFPISITSDALLHREWTDGRGLEWRQV